MPRYKFVFKDILEAGVMALFIGLGSFLAMKFLPVSWSWVSKSMWGISLLIFIVGAIVLPLMDYVIEKIKPVKRFFRGGI